MFNVQEDNCSVSDPHFFADPDPGKNLHADPDPGGIRGVKEKNENFLSFFTLQMFLKNLKKDFYFSSQGFSERISCDPNPDS